VAQQKQAMHCLIKIGYLNKDQQTSKTSAYQTPSQKPIKKRGESPIYKEDRQKKGWKLMLKSKKFAQRLQPEKRV
jgi:hypothetical protein